jgi:hypothetical protein
MIITVKGKVTDLYNKPVGQAKVIWTDKDGKPVEGADGKTLGTVADLDGNYQLAIPSLPILGAGLVPASPFITAKAQGFPDETLNFISLKNDQGTTNFILGGNSQTEDEVTVTGEACKTFKCKAKTSWNKHKKAYVGAIVGLVILSLVLVIFSINKKNN